MSNRDRTFAFPPGVRVRLSASELADLARADTEYRRRDETAKTRRARRSALDSWSAAVSKLSARAVARRLKMKPGRDRSAIQSAVSTAIERAIIQPKSE
jgi:hypothetical protein